MKGVAFKDACADMMKEGRGDRTYARVIASLKSVPLKFEPLFFQSCAAKLTSGRVCMKRVDAGGACPRCGGGVEIGGTSA